MKRSLIVLLWIASIFIVLYAPRWNLFPSKEKSINIFTWGGIFEPSIVAQFEKEQGVKVRLNYYASNEELLVKLRATGGYGYDLIVPSDYAVKRLAEEAMLKEIDKTQLTFWKEINPLLLNHPFDPKNRFSIPYAWEIYGLGYDKEYFKEAPFVPSWKMLFEPHGFRVSMLNDPIDVMALSAFYLYGALKPLSGEQIDEIKNLLLRQKSWVAAYANFRGDYFLSTKNCPIVVSTSSYIRRSMKQFPFIGFTTPQEGTFMTLESLCIPKPSEKEELVYSFINYCFSAHSLKTHYETFGFFPASIAHLDALEDDEELRKLILSSPEAFTKYHFLKNLMPEETLHNTWVEVKTLPSL